MTRLAKAFCCAFLGAGLLLPPVSQASAQGEVPAVGTADQCLQLDRIRQTRPVDNKTIVVEMRGSDGWRKMETANTCTGLRMQGSFSYSTSINKLCQGDIIRVTGGVGTPCGLARITAISETEAKMLLAER